MEDGEEDAFRRTRLGGEEEEVEEEVGSPQGERLGGEEEGEEGSFHMVAEEEGEEGTFHMVVEEDSLQMERYGREDVMEETFQKLRKEQILESHGSWRRCREDTSKGENGGAVQAQNGEEPQVGAMAARAAFPSVGSLDASCAAGMDGGAGTAPAGHRRTSEETYWLL